MIGLLLQVLRLFKALAHIVEEPEGRALLILAMIQLLAGTVFYALAEGWRWLDALYFCVTALSTVGYGDLSPSTDLGKIFTVFYILTGVGVLVGSVNLVAQHSLSPRARNGDASDGRPDRP
jgi:voltage-gated potassium channel